MLAYPLVILMISPVCMSFPLSSHLKLKIDVLFFDQLQHLKSVHLIGLTFDLAASSLTNLDSIFF